MEEQVLLRKSPPHIYDHAPQGTLCKVESSDYTYKLYVQKSADEENPDWQELDLMSHIVDKIS